MSGSSKLDGGNMVPPAMVRILWVLLIYCLDTLSLATPQCPRVCMCTQSGLSRQMVYCSRKSLQFIPAGIPQNAAILNLNENTFKNPLLRRNNFTGLVNLEHLYMSDCGLQTIEVDTFAGLRNLQFLDLSSNNIKELQDFSFRGLDLQHLFLRGNSNLRMQQNTFAGLKTTGLYLNQCDLRSVNLSVLQPLNGSLMKLWLDDNELTKLDKNLASLFKTLSHLRLGLNPWHCNCRLAWLKEFYDTNPSIFSGAVAPSCNTPAPLGNKFYNSIDKDEFVCQPPSFKDIDVRFDSTTGQLICSATGDPPPTLFWIKPTGEGNAYTPPVEEDRTKERSVLSLNQGEIDVSGQYMCMAKNPAGNVTFTFNFIWPREKWGKSTTNPTSGEPGEEGDPNGGFPGGEGGGGASDNNGKKVDKYANIHVYIPSQANHSAQLNSVRTSHLHRKQFSLNDLIGAVVGTFLCTSFITFIIIQIFYKCRKRQKRHLHENVDDKTKEHLYMTPTEVKEGIYMEPDSPKRCI